METDIRIILFFILFLFALNTNKENYTNVTPVISGKPIEHNRKIKNFYNDIYKYDTESNYNIQPLYDMLYLLEDKLRDTKKDLHYFDKTTCPDGSDKCVTCSPPELTEGAIFKECGNDIDGYQVIPSGETCELGCAEGYHIIGSPPVIGTCQLIGNPSPRPDELFSGEFRGTFSTKPYIQCSPDKQCNEEHTHHIGPSPDKECFCKPGFFGQSCGIPCDESPSNQIDLRTKEFIGKKFNPLKNICELFCVNGDSNPDQTKCICSPPEYWEGTYCEEIKCIHGRRNDKKTECTDCDPGWTGLHCHQPKCGEHTQRDIGGNPIMDGDKCKCKEDWFGNTCETYCKNPGGKIMKYSDGRTTCTCIPGYHGYGCTTQCPSGTFFDEKIQRCSPIPQGKKDCIGEWNNCSPDPSNNNKCMQKYKIISPSENGGSPCPYNNNEMRDCPYENGCYRHIDPQPGKNPDEGDDTDKGELNKMKFVVIIVIPIILLIVIFTLSKYTKKHIVSNYLVDSGMFHIFITFPFIASCIGLIISYFINRDDLFKFNLNGYILGSCFITFCVSLLLVIKFPRNEIKFKQEYSTGSPEQRRVVATNSRKRRKQYSALYYGIIIVGVIIILVLYYVFKLHEPDTPTGPTNTPTGPTGPTEKIDCYGEWLSVNCLSTGKMTYKIRRPASNGGSPCPYKDGEVSPNDDNDISSPVCPDSKMPASCVPVYEDEGRCGVNCTKKVKEVTPGRGDIPCTYYAGQTVSCSPSECSRNPPSPLDPGEGDDIIYQPDHSIQIINQTSGLLSLFIFNSDPIYRYDPDSSWYNTNKKNKEEGVTIFEPVNWGEGKAIAWDPLGAENATQVNIEKGKKVILEIPKGLYDPGGEGLRKNQFIIKPIKLNTTKKIDEEYQPGDGLHSIKTVVPTQVPNFFELGEGAVSDSSGVDGVNYRIIYELTSDYGISSPIKTEIKDNPCPTSIPKDHQLQVGCWNPAKFGCLNFEGGIDPTATASCQKSSQNCAFNKCSKYFFIDPADNNSTYFDDHHWHDSDEEKKILNESWAKADTGNRGFDGGKPPWENTWIKENWPKEERMPPVKHYIGDWKNIKKGPLYNYCNVLNNPNDDFSTYCYDYADQSSSKNLLSPYKVKIIFGDL